MCDIPKPKMRGLLAAQIRRHVIIASLFAFSNAMAYKVFVADKRKQIMRDYYLDYDPDVSFDQMRKHMESTGSWKPGK
ncbi:cytochrome c oxidase subunit 6C [Nasonia vitripennis]|uniref:Mitochondrial cytochrome c oxidase subunit VIc/VIIs domain-containing protein n=1 Tax=Nasonia vitripennis TaxID=7425 RepID=A0A7M6URZ8_NASVI|nr:cytochrome c oxidase subunit 6C [Nasonia vitripennis]